MIQAVDRSRLRLYTPQPAAVMTLRSYYEGVLLPELYDLSKRSLESDRNALNTWERFTSNPDLQGSTGDELCHAVIALRDGMAHAGLAPATVNKVWREVKAIFEAAKLDGLVEAVPVIRERRRGKIIRGKLVREPAKKQRELISEAELSQLFAQSANATYPRTPRAPDLWRVALVLFWMYGARTRDFFRNLRWDHVLWSQKLLRFTAQKTQKLQGLPMPDWVAEWLRSIRPVSGGPSRVFAGFDTPGSFRLAKQRWREGYYTTWRRDISEGLERVTFKHFRERIVSRFNAVHPGMGHWMAGHSIGSLQMAYDQPTDKIRELIEAVPVPACFRR
jgi:hypothetical protein